MIRQLLLGLLVLLAFVPQAAAFSGGVRTDPVDATFVQGRLVWGPQGGGLRWDSKASEQDPGGPPPPADPTLDAKYIADSVQRSYTAQEMLLPAPDVFVAERLATDLYLNVSKTIHVDLYIKNQPSAANVYYTTSCPLVDLELLLDGELLAGGHVGVTDGLTDHQSPALGYTCAVKHRLQAERVLLPAGSILTLRILHVSQLTHYQYGMGGDHASVLRLPTHTPNEVRFRYPAPSTDPTPAALAVFALLWPGNRPKTGGLVLLMLLSGCVGGGSGGAAGSTSARAGPSGGAPGVLVGSVGDDQAEAVFDAYVALADTSYFTRTDTEGQFVLAGVPAGDYDVVVESSGFHQFRAPVTIRANETRHVGIVLQPLSTDPGRRAHRHDDWNGATRIDFDEVVLEPQAFGTIDGFTWTIPTPERVLPGTTMVAITITWTDEAIPRVFLGAQPNHDLASDNRTWLYARGSGETFHLATNKEMTDSGHQKASTWGRFQIDVPRGDARYTDAYTTPHGPFTVRMSIERGPVVPLEPRHGDPWKGASTVPVLTKEESGMYCYAIACQGQSQQNASWLVTRLVPQGTTWVEVELKASRAYLPPPVAEADDWVLTLKGATSAQDGCPKNQHQDDMVVPRLAVDDGANLRWVWRQAITDAMADPFYAKRSMWCVWVSPTAQRAQLLDYWTNAFVAGEMSFTLSLVAHRDAMPSS